MDKKRHIFTTIWIWLQIGICGIIFFKDVLSAPISTIFVVLQGFFYVMLLFWYRWAFWGLIVFRLLDLLGLFKFIPIEDGHGFDGSKLSYALIHIVNFLILFGVLQIKNKEINKSTWEQLKYRIMGKNKEVVEKRNPENELSQKCPFCANNIKKEAIVCQFCGRDLPEEIIKRNKEEIEILKNKFEEENKELYAIDETYMWNSPDKKSEKIVEINYKQNLYYLSSTDDGLWFLVKTENGEQGYCLSSKLHKKY